MNRLNNSQHILSFCKNFQLYDEKDFTLDLMNTNHVATCMQYLPCSKKTKAINHTIRTILYQIRKETLIAYVTHFCTQRSTQWDNQIVLKIVVNIHHLVMHNLSQSLMFVQTHLVFLTQVHRNMISQQFKYFIELTLILGHQIILRHIHTTFSIQVQHVGSLLTVAYLFNRFVFPHPFN